MEKYKFRVQEAKRVRIIIDTDADCEADDQFAIAHALMTPLFDIRGIIAEQFGCEGSVERSFNEALKVMKLMGISGIPVFKGEEKPLEAETSVTENEAVDFIINEALKEDSRPLYVLCQGAITNVAYALNQCPEIAERFTCIWIGGGFYPEGGREFNLCNDINGANAVFKSKVNLWQVPMSCYTTMQVGYAELQAKVMPCGEIGKYLFEQMIELGLEQHWIAGESWSLGDSPAIGLALNPGCGRYNVRKAPVFDKDGYYKDCESNREIRVYYSVDSRYILEDFFAKLSINYKE
ncbi:MAG: nucleoside hydrolase [Ruminiclostridium sp.]|nr:nucleoside hydrolase [Ruminiclostridium sp.]